MDLSSVVECEIIPRLMLAHAQALEEAPMAPGADEDANLFAIEALVELALSADADRMLAFVDAQVAAGQELHAIYLDLLAPVARRLGSLWSDDRVTYSDVTIALGRLQHLIRLLSWTFPTDRDDGAPVRTALFAPAPGEQHIFGLIMVEDSFRRAGWRTWLETDLDAQALVQIGADHWFDMAGFTLAKIDLADRLAVVIRRLRAASQNKALFVMVGGAALDQDPHLFERLGADATAADGFQALTIAGERVCHVI